MTPLLLTGTDTGVGKTHVAAALLRAITRIGVPIMPVKLIETGLAPRSDGSLQPADGLRLAHAAGRDDELDLVSPFQFRLAAAPITASRDEGRIIRVPDLLAAIDRARTVSPRVLIETAGGLLVPIAPGFDYADLAVRLGARVVVVARNALGTLNHTALTVEAAARRGLRVVAVILDQLEPTADGLPHADDLQALFPDTPILGPLPYGDGTDDERADAFERCVIRAEDAVAWFD